MFSNIIRRNIRLLAACAAVFLILAARAPFPSLAAAEQETGDWPCFESRYFTICHDPDVDLDAVDRRLNKRSFFAVGAEYRSSDTDSINAKIGLRLDMLFTRAREVLDMWPYRLHIKIRIFKDSEDLGREYERIFGTYASYRAFYIYNHNIIYTSEEGISDSVMAHEMGHAIVDHYFSIIPPEKVRELLATYVDAHLDED